VTSRADFSDEEWEILVRAPLLACWAVIAAAPTGSVGTVNELQAMLGVMKETRHATTQDSIIGALAASLRHRLDRSEMRVRELPREVLEQRTLEASREAVALLQAREATVHLPEYRDWVVHLAQAVADASKEGGGLGGSDRVQPQEFTLIDDIRRALDQGGTHG
jgi:hypothetical protein